jgi:uncharacterized surface anchored protein
MTRTDVMASSRPRTPSAPPARSGSRSILRGLSVVPVVLLSALAIVVPGTAFAAEPTTGYGTTSTPTTTTPTTSTPTTTTTTTTPATTPTTGTLPAKEAETPTSTTPKTETTPAKASTAPTTSTEKATTLPFTGFDLRWDIGLGLVLMGAGFLIVVMQRRQRRHGGR